MDDSVRPEHLRSIPERRSQLTSMVAEARELVRKAQMHKRAEARERKAAIAAMQEARRICERFGIKVEVIMTGGAKEHGHS